MNADPTTRDNFFAALLSAACGMADAVGYAGTGIFAANMTGNTVLVGLAVAGRDWALAAERAITVATFFLGAMVGRRLAVLAGILLQAVRFPLVVPAVMLLILTALSLRR